jgi:hypothetical protein
MILCSAAAAIAFPKKRFRYRAGVLHSANDEPAAVLQPAKFDCIRGRFLQTICGREKSDSAVVTYTPYKKLDHGISLWYCEGDIHRDLGPASIDGDYRLAWRKGDSCVGWHKYHRGKQMASGANTFTGGLGAYKPQLDPCRACTKSCSKVAARDTILHSQDANFGEQVLQYLTAYTYQTCVGTLIECSRYGQQIPDAAVWYRVAKSPDREKTFCHDAVRLDRRR